MKTNNIVLVIGEESLQKELDTIASGKFESFRVSNSVDGIAIALMIQPLAVLIDSDSLQVEETKLRRAVTKHEGFHAIPLLFASKTPYISGEIKNLSNFKGQLKRPLDPKETLARIPTLDGDVSLSIQPTEQVIEGSEVSAKKKDNSMIKVLSVDDSSVVRKLVSMILTAEGFKVTTASNGLDGINKAKEIMPDLILLDFVMPRMNGFQVCRILQKDEQLKHIPVILVTSKGDKVGDKFVNQLGVTDYITKPFQPEELIAKIRHALENRDIQKSLPASSVAEADLLYSPGELSQDPSISEPGTPISSQVVPSQVQQNVRALIKEEISNWLSGDFENRVGKVVEAKLTKLFQEKIMKVLEKHMEKIVQDKIIEYIKKAKQQN